MAFRMTRSLCIQATMATKDFFPAFTIRAWKLEMTGLHRMADMVAMYNTALTAARPPPIILLPWRLPLSQLIGATPIKADTCFRLIVPSSGNWANSVRDKTGPTPGTDWRTSWS